VFLPSPKEKAYSNKKLKLMNIMGGRWASATLKNDDKDENENKCFIYILSSKT
jgi:hypothetical protein